MKILMIVGKASHSMGTSVVSLSDALATLGEDVSVIAEPTTAKRFRLKNVLPLWPVPTGKFHLIASNFRRLRRARQTLAEADVVHVHGRRAAMFGMFLTILMRPRPPILVSLYEGAADFHDTVFNKLFFRWLGMRASLISGSTLNLTARINAQISSDAAVSFLISPRVERLQEKPLANRKERVEKWEKLAKKERLKNRGQLVLAIGTIEPEKRLDLFVKAMEHVTYPATAVVIGDGDPQLLAQLRSLGADAQVSFLGWRKDLETWYEAASVLVVTSEWESRGFVTQEAMTLGLPVVAQPVGRLRDILMSPEAAARPASRHAEEFTGDVGVGALLVNVANPEQTAAAITKLLSNPGIWYEKQEAARKRALTWPTMSDVAQKWLNFYEAAKSPS